MRMTFHKWVLNAMADPNPTQYTKFDEYDWSEMGFIYNFAYSLLLFAIGVRASQQAASRSGLRKLPLP